MATSEEFRIAGKDMIDYVIDYINTCGERPPLAKVTPGYLQDLIPLEAPEKPESWDDIKKDIERVIMPGVTHWNSPHFHAFFPAGSSYPSILGDILMNATTNIGFSWIAGPACTELEMIVLNWLVRMMKLPHVFLNEKGSPGGGSMQGSSSESTLYSLLAAKMRMIRRMKELNSDLDQFDVLPKFIAYISDQTLFCVEKACMIASVRRRILPTDENFILRGNVLRAAIEKDKDDGMIPLFVCATLGTTHSLAFDPLEELGPICLEHDVWLHVDAAYAGTAFICPEYRHFLNGVEYVTSLNISPHKLMRVHIDLSILWVKSRADIEKAFFVDPAIMRHEHQEDTIDYRHWQIPVGRKFRSLKLWFVLRMFGQENLQRHVRNQAQLAKEFRDLMASDPRFTIIAEVVLGLVCFRLKGSDEQNKELLDCVNKSGDIFITGTQLKEQYVLRFVVCAASTESKHIRFAWKAIEGAAGKLLQKEH